MPERDGSVSGVSRRLLLRGGVSALAATALSTRGASAVPRSSDKPETVVNVVDLGAVGDGRTDDSGAFEIAYASAAARVSDGVGRVVVEIPAGEFLITRPLALLNGTAPPRPASGLRFSGAGKRMTSLVFRPGTGPGSYLCRNQDVWSNLSFERMQFRSATPGASFFDSYSTGQAQDYRFSECEWRGEWEYGLVLSGTDTNSEMRWEACRVGGRYRRAFLYSGLTRNGQQKPNDQDQFLNYWFTDMKVEYEWGNFLEFPYGGSVACRGGSYIITDKRPQSTPEYGTTSTFFRFPVSRHHDSVQRFHAQDIRFEVRDPDVVVIDCAWNSGTVHFDDCDDTGLAFKDFSAEVRPHRYTVGPRGPLIRYDSCQLVGRHLYRPASADALPVVARYDMCLLRSHTAHDFAVADGTHPVPFVQFVDCVDAGTTSDAPGPASPATPPPPPCLTPSPDPSPAPATAPEPAPATPPGPTPATTSGPADITSPAMTPEPSPATTPHATDAPAPRHTAQADCSSPQQKPP
ncbi:glycosyl hydrolase family 28-related protein [Streptomyces sp. NRRL S-1022]|uniref:glycosyl hydrolase family 28-related protein n=1 Tax=Streptomyces sp. NRRL S-1022 TaxID=1463880 RepID=UPI00227713CB|nr:glycosyl hydrolase family 28-related protein [Streptomyces sp. NRRL S-1022]